MAFNYRNGMQRIQIVLIAVIFLISSFSQNFVFKLYSILPEVVKWPMVATYNLIVVDFFYNIGLDSEFWWGFGRGLSTAMIVGLFIWFINKLFTWAYAGFIK